MKTMTKPPIVDIKSDPLYRAKTQPEYVNVPAMPFIYVDGVGSPKPEPGRTDFQRAMQVLFTIMYTIKFWDKKHTAPADYAPFTMPPIEALWWSEDGLPFGQASDDHLVNDRFFQEVVREVMNQKAEKSFLEARFDYIEEGPSIQIMHIGPYDQEKRSVDALMKFAEQQHLGIAGKHHELYFSDPRRTAPEKLKTMVRYPVKELS